MAPQVPQEKNDDRPSQPSSGSTTDKTIQRPHRGIKRQVKVSESFSRHFSDPNNRAQLQERHRELTAQWEAEQERRHNLDLCDRLMEDGRELRQKIESNSAMIAFLEKSRSGRARCRAYDDCCIYAQENTATGKTIATKFRIRLEGVKDPSFWGLTTHYYHVECFECMVDLEELIPEKVQLEDRSWGLMVRKWFEHRGQTNLAKIETYIKEYKVFEKECERADSDRVERDMQWWGTGHHDCARDEAGCSRPLPPKLAETPILSDYVLKEGDICCLDDVLSHELVDELPDMFWTVGWCVARLVPEVEDVSQVERAENAEPTSEIREDVDAEEKGGGGRGSRRMKSNK